MTFVDFQQAFLPPVYAIEFCVAFFGNSLAIWLLCTREKVWHTGIVYSFNLAVSDLLYVLSLPLLAIYFVKGKDWTFGTALCKIERYLFTCNLYGSIFFITCISINRYIGIVHPFYSHSKVQPKHAKMASLAVWVLVIVISIPVLVFSTTMPRNNKMECLGSSTNEHLGTYLYYSIFLAVFGCGLPFLITLVCYIAIFWTVFTNQNLTCLQKKKVYTIIVIVVLLYAISFLPYHVLRNLNLKDRLSQQGCNSIFRAYQITKGLVILNMCIHPLLYAAVADSLMLLCGNCWRNEPMDRKAAAGCMDHDSEKPPFLQPLDTVP
ncbi:P2Y purinoceptor 1-like [Latimeria chalumnae]|uniref:P2Y purinoceptor 1-like n=1 Tax=Latimeria chalumnae TaxID=7897 RepID=UPI00313B0BF5